jgi:hypothetical protein
MLNQENPHYPSIGGIFTCATSLRRWGMQPKHLTTKVYSIPPSAVGTSYSSPSTCWYALPWSPIATWCTIAAYHPPWHIMHTTCQQVRVVTSVLMYRWYFAELLLSVFASQQCILTGCLFREQQAVLSYMMAK